MTALLLATSLALIVAAAELFTNAVEWAGFRLRLGSGATGSLLAATGTSLPEIVVPIIALLSRAPSADSVAIGAILGSSFLLLTLGVGITGVAVALRRDAPALTINRSQVRRDLGTFLVAFSGVIVCVVLAHPVRVGVAVGLLLLYAGYVRATLRAGAPAEEMPSPLHLLGHGHGRDPHGLTIAGQLLVALAMLVVGAELFVRGLEATADQFKVPALVIALVIVPVATELPETLNGVLWVRSRDDGLAFGNVAGSATLQACVLGAIGVTFTTWSPRGLGLLSAPLTLVTAAGLLLLLRHGRAQGRTLALAMVPWIAYVAVAVATGGRLGGG